jgi:hypothetical protein
MSNVGQSVMEARDLFLPDVFEVAPFPPAERNSRRRQAQTCKPVGRRPIGQKSLLSAKDFILPDLVGQNDSGDLSVSMSSSSDGVQLAQVFRLAERGQESLPSFSDFSHPEPQLERRRYFDHLKRVPKREIEQVVRREDLATWKQGGTEAEANFFGWWERKQARKKAAFSRKANRVANCGASGRRMDCSAHVDHQFFGEFKCQCRYCRRCGSGVFSALFGKYIGLWPTVQTLHPQNGFRSKVVIAKLDFTAVNLGRMATPEEIRDFNQDIRECVRRVAKESGIGAKDYGLLWCDEFGGFDPRKKSYNTNLHAHGVFVGPYIPQQLFAKVWTEIRADKDGAKIVWISRQKIDNPPANFLECERRRFVRALGHALKYTGKHVARSDGERLADLEVAFHTVRRVHTMGLFYHANLTCSAKCGECDTQCQLANGHGGKHDCKRHGQQNRCPVCEAYLMFPRDSGYAPVSDLKREGRRELGEVRRQLSRDRILQEPRGPDAKAPCAA